MANSRQKGKRGELEVARILREYGFNARRGQQFSGANGDPDVVGLPGVHLEVKRREKFEGYDWLAQAARDARPGEIPAVWWRKNDHRWVVMMDFEDFIRLYSEAYEEREYEANRTDS